MNSLEHPCGRQRSLEHSQGTTQPPPGNASVLAGVAVTLSGAKVSDERKVLVLLYKDPVRHQEHGVCCQAHSRTGGLSLQQGPEKGWCTAVSRGMASSPF